MRVLLVTNVRAGGGTERHVSAIASKLNLETAYLEDGWGQLSRRIHRGGYDCIHSFLPRAYLATSVIPFKGKRIYSRRALSYGHHRAVRLLEPLCHSITDILVGNSPEVCEELRHESQGADIRLIRNGYMGGAAVPRVPNRTVFTIVCVANVWKHKHHEVLINAFKACRDRLPDPSRLVLVGRGTEQFNVHDRVYGYGYRTDIPDILSSSDVFVMPSCAEGCPNAVLEAMAAGVPVIASDVGGNKDAIEHGYSGALVPPLQPERLASALLWVAKCPEQFSLMAENAKKEVSTKFSMERCLDEYRKLYAGKREKAWIQSASTAESSGEMPPRRKRIFKNASMI